MSAARWGILGGIFDPIHFAHLTIAEQTREALNLEGVIFVPAGQPVHRDTPLASPADRLRMVEMATGDNPHFRVSSIEIDSPTPSYSVETVQTLTEESPADDYVFIMSGEAAAGLPEWREPERLLDLAEIALVPRLGYEMVGYDWLDEHFPGRAHRFKFVEASHLGHSATEVRMRARERKSIRYLVPPLVEAYITDNHLYMEQPTDGSDDRRAA